MALIPDLRAKGRGLVKELHKATGIWISLVMAVFLLTGLAWIGVWGDLYVKPWSGFPAAKWDDVPLPDLTHVDLHEVPWAVEAVEQPVPMDTMVM